MSPSWLFNGFAHTEGGMVEQLCVHSGVFTVSALALPWTQAMKKGSALEVPSQPRCDP